MATGKYKEGRAARGSNWTPVGGIAVHGCERAEWATYAWEVDSLPLKVLVRFGVAEKEGEVVLGPADIKSLMLELKGADRCRIILHLFPFLGTTPRPEQRREGKGLS